MRSEDLLRLLRRIPFVPFRFFVIGEEAAYEVTNPELATVSRSTIMLESREMLAGYPVVRQVFIALLHIRRIESIVHQPTNGG
jgi:hypothetical protein